VLSLRDPVEQSVAGLPTLSHKDVHVELIVSEVALAMARPAMRAS
jgi:hypothetical protein